MTTPTRPLYVLTAYDCDGRSFHLRFDRTSDEVGVAPAMLTDALVDSLRAVIADYEALYGGES